MNESSAVNRSKAKEMIRLDGRRILVVEDSPTQALRLRHALEQVGCQVRVARNGGEALEATSAGALPDAVITDILMPVMDGFEFCRRFKAAERTASVPVVLLTTLSDPADLIRGLQCGAETFLVKPYEDGFLLATLEKLLGGETQANGPEEEFHFEGRSYRIGASKQQVMRFLLATYEEAVQRNRQLQKLNQELQSAQQQLAAKNVELEKLNATKNQFLGMAAHDLRNPLNVIANYAEILQEDLHGRVGQDEIEIIEQVHKASNFMLKLVNDLLDISKIESGTLELRREKVQPEEFIERNVQLNRVFAERKGIELVFHATPPLPVISIDRAKFEQVLNNLIGNAIKFSSSGTRVSVGVCALADGEVEIQVSDQGRGIPPEELEHIFKPFRRSGGAQEESESGTGLGLAIVRRIVESHGGRVSVESQLGVGSTFRVLMPSAG